MSELPMQQEHIEGEAWRDVIGYEGVYEVSDYGRVRRVKTGRILRPHWNERSNSYMLALTQDGVSKSFSIHKLVAQAWIGEKPEGKQIIHDDLDGRNNRPNNLLYVTPHEATLHTIMREGFGRALPIQKIQEVIELLTQEDPRLNANEIAERTGLNANTVNNIARGKRVGYGLRGADPVATGKNRRKIKRPWVIPPHERR